MLIFASCAPVERVQFTRFNEPCETIKVRPDWYSAQTMTACLTSDHKIEPVQTNASDISILAGAASIVAAVISLCAIP